MLTFTFEGRWSDTVDDMLQAVTVVIFKMPQEPLEMLQRVWATQLSSALECYNVQVEEDDDDPRNIIIKEFRLL